MDDDAERGVIFTLGLALGLLAMWLVFTARGRQAARQMLEAAGDLAEAVGDQAEELVEQATEAAEAVQRRIA
jgi:hypothetical protein